MKDDKQIRFLKSLLAVELGLDGEKILDASTRLNQILNKIPYKLEYLERQNKPMKRMVRLDLRRFVGVIKRYQSAVKSKKAESLGFFKKKALNKFRIKFERSLDMID